MKHVLNVILVVGYIGIAFVYGHTTVMLYLYNELDSDAFTFYQQQGVITEVRERVSDVVISYEYKVDSIMYQQSIDIGKKWFARTGYAAGDGVNIYYNSKYPSVSYIENLYNEDKKSVRYIFFAPFLLILIIATFADRDKWIKRYRRAFGFPD